MGKYRLKKGKRHHVAARTRTTSGRIEPGEVVELTDKQYESFKDKFEPADAPLVESPVSDEVVPDAPVYYPPLRERGMGELRALAHDLEVKPQGRTKLALVEAIEGAD